jgi:hypothetical protein
MHPINVQHYIRGHINVGILERNEAKLIEREDTRTTLAAEMLNHIDSFFAKYAMSNC